MNNLKIQIDMLRKRARGAKITCYAYDSEIFITDGYVGYFIPGEDFIIAPDGYTDCIAEPLQETPDYFRDMIEFHEEEYYLAQIANNLLALDGKTVLCELQSEDKEGSVFINRDFLKTFDHPRLYISDYRSPVRVYEHDNWNLVGIIMPVRIPERSTDD